MNGPAVVWIEVDTARHRNILKPVARAFSNPREAPGKFKLLHCAPLRRVVRSLLNTTSAELCDYRWCFTTIGIR